MGKATYSITEAFAKKRLLIHFMDGARVNLAGQDIEVKGIDTKDGPAVKSTIKAVTQSQLEYLYEKDAGNWTRMIKKTEAKKVIKEVVPKEEN